jgi:hypothetical protein
MGALLRIKRRDGRRTRKYPAIEAHNPKQTM